MITACVTATSAPAILSAAQVGAEIGDDVERYVEVEGRRVRVGTYADAGALCNPPISGSTYRRYTLPGLLDPPAPGPLTIPDPDGGAGTVLTDGGTRAPLVDLDAAIAWDAGRPGSGRRPQTAATLRETPLRRRLLEAARTGRLVVVRSTRQAARRATEDRPEGGWGWQTYIGDEQLPSRRAGQSRAELQEFGLLSAPDPAGAKRQHLALLPAGVEVLTRWGDTSTES